VGKRVGTNEKVKPIKTPIILSYRVIPYGNGIVSWSKKSSRVELGRIEVQNVIDEETKLGEGVAVTDR
jgi:hypothetical protein